MKREQFKSFRFNGKTINVECFRCQPVRSLRLQHHEEETVWEDKLRSERLLQIYVRFACEATVHSFIIAFHRIQEFLTILSKVSRGSVEEKLQWIFGLYDLDGDGLISKEEMLDVVGSIYEMLGRYTQPQIVEPHLAAREHVDRIFHVSKRDRSRFCPLHVKLFADLFEPRLIDRKFSSN